jgi:hypothetical protein
MTTPIANYEAPRKAFDALLAAECAARILLLRGESGSGKTTVMTHCCSRIPAGVAHVPVQLRGTVVNVAEIFYRVGMTLGWSALPRFMDRVAASLTDGSARVAIENNQLEGMNNRISVVLNSESESKREERRSALTNALFEDLSARRGLVLMLFDTFEHAPIEVQGWLSGPFLARAVQTPCIRVVIAGQSVPDSTNIEWGPRADLHDFFGVIEAKHWMPVVSAMRRRIDVDNPVSWLAGVCHAVKGRPDAIMKIIEGLPREVGG